MTNGDNTKNVLFAEARVKAVRARCRRFASVLERKILPMFGPLYRCHRSAPFAGEIPEPNYIHRLVCAMPHHAVVCPALADYVGARKELVEAELAAATARVGIAGELPKNQKRFDKALESAAKTAAEILRV